MESSASHPNPTLCRRVLAIGRCHDKFTTWKSLNSDGLAEQAKSLSDLRTTLLLFYLSSGAFSRAHICCRCKRFNLSAIKLLARVGRMDNDWLPLRRANWEGLLGARSECTARCFMTRRQSDYWWDPSCTGLRCVSEKTDTSKCTHGGPQRWAVYHNRQSATAIRLQPNLQTLIVNWTPVSVSQIKQVNMTHSNLLCQSHEGPPIQLWAIERHEVTKLRKHNKQRVNPLFL